METPTVSTTRIEGALLDKTAAVDWLDLDEKKGEVRIDGKLLILSRKEYDLILFLSKRAGSVCQRDELIAGVWPEVLDPGGVSDAAIDQLVHRLRLKIEPDPSHPRRLVSRKGFGFMLV
jgi:DNA-binding response OmpR family regulator